MALFTDIEAVTASDLLTFESALAQTAASYGINVTGKISLAQQAVGDRVMLWLSEWASTGVVPLGRAGTITERVVLTAPLKRWICLEAIARVYAEAYDNQLNTKFQSKWNEYKTEAKLSGELVVATGVGLVSAPLPQPALPLVSVQSGNSPAQSLTVASCWTDSRGDESALSPINTAALPASSGIAVGMAEGVSKAPSTATGWNIYVASAGSDLTRQNLQALSIGSTWELPASGLRIGTVHTGGQAASNMVYPTRLLRRG